MMRYTRPFLLKPLCTILCLLLLGLAHARENESGGILKGKVTTADQKPADGVTVVIKGTKKAAITTEDGRFQFKNIAPGSYTIEVSLIGYTPVQKDIVLEEGKTAVADLQLAVSNQELQHIVVTASRKSYVKTQSETVAKMPLKNMENPQVYTTVPKEILQDQLVVTYADALKNIPGVVMQLENNSAGGTVTSRGFSTQSFLRNGVPGLVGSGTIDPANIETIEAIKGPSGTLYGGSAFASFGGLFNRVTKKPFDAFKTEVSYTAGGYGLSRIAADVNAPLNKEKTLLLRTNAAKYSEGSFQDAGFKNYIFLAPTLTYQVDDKTMVTAELEYRNEKGNGFYRMFADGSYATGVRSPKDLKIDFNKRFLGDDVYTTNNATNVYLQLDHTFSSQWKSQTNYTYLSTNANGMSGYLSMKAGNDSLIRNVSYTEYSNIAATDIQENLTGDFRIGSMRNRLVAGLEFYSITTKSSGSPNIAFDVISASRPGVAYTQATRTAILDRAKSLAFTKGIVLQNTYSAYLQDVLNITDRLIALAAVRVDRFDNRGTRNLALDTTTGKYAQTAVSPKFGLVYQLVKEQVSLFGNYMNGFQNQAPLYQTDPATGKAGFSTFNPVQANQWEAGVKVNLLQNKLTGSVSYYNIKVTDITRPDAPDRPLFTIQNGEQYSKGIEAEVVAQPFSGFNLMTGYAYNDSKLEKTNPATDGLRPISAGPAHTVNLWASYRLQYGKLKGLGLGFGGNYASENLVILSTTSRYALPAYTVLGVSASYDQPHYRISCKVDNVTNEKYWVGWSTTIPQMPMRFSASVALKF